MEKDVEKQYEPNYVDVICQFKKDGSIVPIKFRVLTEDGEYQEFNVKGYRRVFDDFSANHIPVKKRYPFISTVNQCFECRIESFGRQRSVWLYYHTQKARWALYI